MKRSRVKVKAIVILFLVFFVEAIENDSEDSGDNLAPSTESSQTNLSFQLEPNNGNNGVRKLIKKLKLYSVKTDDENNNAKESKKIESEDADDMVGAVKESASLMSQFVGNKQYVIMPIGSDKAPLRVIPPTNSTTQSEESGGRKNSRVIKIRKLKQPLAARNRQTEEAASAELDVTEATAYTIADEQSSTTAKPVFRNNDLKASTRGRLKHSDTDAGIAGGSGESDNYPDPEQFRMRVEEVKGRRFQSHRVPEPPKENDIIPPLVRQLLTQIVAKRNNATAAPKKVDDVHYEVTQNDADEKEDDDDLNRAEDSRYKSPSQSTNGGDGQKQSQSKTPILRNNTSIFKNFRAKVQTTSSQSTTTTTVAPINSDDRAKLQNNENGRLKIFNARNNVNNQALLLKKNNNQTQTDKNAEIADVSENSRTPAEKSQNSSSSQIKSSFNNGINQSASSYDGRPGNKIAAVNRPNLLNNARNGVQQPKVSSLPATNFGENTQSLKQDDARSSSRSNSQSLRQNVQSHRFDTQSSREQTSSPREKSIGDSNSSERVSSNKGRGTASRGNKKFQPSKYETFSPFITDSHLKGLYGDDSGEYSRRRNPDLDLVRGRNKYSDLADKSSVEFDDGSYQGQTSSDYYNTNLRQDRTKINAGRRPSNVNSVSQRRPSSPENRAEDSNSGEIASGGNDGTRNTKFDVRQNSATTQGANYKNVNSRNQIRPVTGDIVSRGGENNESTSVISGQEKQPGEPGKNEANSEQRFRPSGFRATGAGSNYKNGNTGGPVVNPNIAAGISSNGDVRIEDDRKKSASPIGGQENPRRTGFGGGNSSNSKYKPRDENESDVSVTSGRRNTEDDNKDLSKAAKEASNLNTNQGKYVGVIGLRQHKGEASPANGTSEQSSLSTSGQLSENKINLGTSVRKDQLGQRQNNTNESSQSNLENNLRKSTNTAGTSTNRNTGSKISFGSGVSGLGALEGKYTEKNVNGNEQARNRGNSYKNSDSGLTHEQEVNSDSNDFEQQRSTKLGENSAPSAGNQKSLSNVGNSGAFGSSNVGNSEAFGSSKLRNSGAFGSSNVRNSGGFESNNKGNSGGLGSSNVGNSAGLGSSDVGNSGAFGSSKTKNSGAFGTSNVGNSGTFGSSNVRNSGGLESSSLRNSGLGNAESNQDPSGTYRNREKATTERVREPSQSPNSNQRTNANANTVQKPTSIFGTGAFGIYNTSLPFIQTSQYSFSEVSNFVPEYDDRPLNSSDSSTNRTNSDSNNSIYAASPAPEESSGNEKNSNFYNTKQQSQSSNDRNKQQNFNTHIQLNSESQQSTDSRFRLQEGHSAKRDDLNANVDNKYRTDSKEAGLNGQIPNVNSNSDLKLSLNTGNNGPSSTAFNSGNLNLNRGNYQSNLQSAKSTLSPSNNGNSNNFNRGSTTSAPNSRSNSGNFQKTTTVSSIDINLSSTKSKSGDSNFFSFLNGKNDDSASLQKNGTNSQNNIASSQNGDHNTTASVNNKGNSPWLDDDLEDFKYNTSFLSDNGGVSRGINTSVDFRKVLGKNAPPLVLPDITQKRVKTQFDSANESNEKNNDSASRSKIAQSDSSKPSNARSSTTAFAGGASSRVPSTTPIPISRNGANSKPDSNFFSFLSGKASSNDSPKLSTTTAKSTTIAFTSTSGLFAQNQGRNSNGNGGGGAHVQIGNSKSVQNSNSGESDAVETSKEDFRVGSDSQNYNSGVFPKLNTFDADKKTAKSVAVSDNKGSNENYSKESERSTSKSFESSETVDRFGSANRDLNSNKFGILNNGRPFATNKLAAKQNSNFNSNNGNYQSTSTESYSSESSRQGTGAELLNTSENIHAFEARNNIGQGQRTRTNLDTRTSRINQNVQDSTRNDYSEYRANAGNFVNKNSSPNTGGRFSLVTRKRPSDASRDNRLDGEGEERYGITSQVEIGGHRFRQDFEGKRQKPEYQKIEPTNRGSTKYELDPYYNPLVYDNDEGAYFPAEFGYKFDTSDGISAYQRGTLKRIDDHNIYVVKGAYQYTAPDGTLVNVVYTADENGFHPEIISPDLSGRNTVVSNVATTKADDLQNIAEEHYETVTRIDDNNEENYTLARSNE